MDTTAREKRWREAYNLQKAAFEAKRARKEENMKKEITAIDEKISELQERRAAIEANLRKVAEDTFRDFETFQKDIISQSERSNSSSKLSSTEEKPSDAPTAD